MTHKYQEHNGTSYHIGTPIEIVRILERCRQSGDRIRLHYGNTSTGQDWGETHNVTGTIHRSMGPVRIPILLRNNRSVSGGVILDQYIIRIRSSRKEGSEYYRHPQYHQ